MGHHTGMDRPPGRHWEGHVIVCGLQGVGLRTVEQLHQAGVAVVVVDDEPEPRLVRVVEAWDVPFIVGSPRIGGVLEQAGLVDGPGGGLRRAHRGPDPGDRPADQRDCDPEIRVVVQLANAAVGAAVSQVTGPGTVLDVAALAAPSIVEACLGSDSYQIELAGTRFVTSEVEVDRFASLRALFGSLAPVAVVPADGSPTVACPGRDHTVSIGDRVTVLGTPEELPRPGRPVRPRRAVGDHSGLRRPPRTGRRRCGGCRSVLGSEANSVLRVAMVAALGLVVAVGGHPPAGLPACPAAATWVCSPPSTSPSRPSPRWGSATSRSPDQSTASWCSGSS